MSAYVVSRKQMDSVQEETLAVSATGIVVDNKHNRLLLLQRHRHRLTEEDLRKALAPGEKVLLEGKVKKRPKVTSKEIARIRRVIIGILPYVKITKLNRDANSATHVCLRLTGSSARSRRKVVERTGCLIKRGLNNRGACPKIQSYRRSLFDEGVDNWDQIAPSNSPRADSTT